MSHLGKQKSQPTTKMGGKASEGFDIETEYHLHLDLAMYVCVCNAINDAAILDAIDAGADSVEAILEEMGLGDVCGNCTEFGRKRIEEHLRGKEMRIA